MHGFSVTPNTLDLSITFLIYIFKIWNLFFPNFEYNNNNNIKKNVYYKHEVLYTCDIKLPSSHTKDFIAWTPQ